MSKAEFPIDQTMCIDDCICPYCGHKFDGGHAVNYDMCVSSVICPQCKEYMNVSISVEYMCTAVEE